MALKAARGPGEVVEVAYQLSSVVLAINSAARGRARDGLTSDELEGLRYELIAVLVVGHDCGCVG